MQPNLSHWNADGNRGLLVECLSVSGRVRAKLRSPAVLVMFYEPSAAVDPESRMYWLSQGQPCRWADWV
jgi:hypothetical protein